MFIHAYRGDRKKDSPAGSWFVSTSTMTDENKILTETNYQLLIQLVYRRTHCACYCLLCVVVITYVNIKLHALCGEAPFFYIHRVKDTCMHTRSLLLPLQVSMCCKYWRKPWLTLVGSMYTLTTRMGVAMYKKKQHSTPSFFYIPLTTHMYRMLWENKRGASRVFSTTAAATSMEFEIDYLYLYFIILPYFHVV